METAVFITNSQRSFPTRTLLDLISRVYLQENTQWNTIYFTVIVRSCIVTYFIFHIIYEETSKRRGNCIKQTLNPHTKHHFLSLLGIKWKLWRGAVKENPPVITLKLLYNNYTVKLGFGKVIILLSYIEKSCSESIKL